MEGRMGQFLLRRRLPPSREATADGTEDRCSLTWVVRVMSGELRGEQGSARWYAGGDAAARRPYHFEFGFRISECGMGFPNLPQMVSYRAEMHSAQSGEAAGNSQGRVVGF
jgi:hypothetical protein